MLRNLFKTKHPYAVMKIGMLACLVIASLSSHAQHISAAHQIPHLEKIGNNTKLVVDGKPFLILGGELGNSTTSNSAYMKPVWAKLKKMNLNTVIAPVYWELMEPKEGVFDFKLVDEMIFSARQQHLKLVLLWFGAWKNSMSCYAPEWVKTNASRFPRAYNKTNGPEEILSPFSQNNLQADKRAFVKLMTHLKVIDGIKNTVITVQVENEIGMLPNARSYEPAATAAFNAPVPAKLLNYLQNNKPNLLPETRAIWAANGFKNEGTWVNVFGNSPATDELFMAWYYGVYTNEVAKAGKSVYNLPMYVNAALNRPGKLPGEYPSAGPLPHVADIWTAAAPDIDILAPDFYNPDFKHWCDLYTRRGKPLFIPEIKFENGVDAKAFFAYGNYNCLSFSPFSIESVQKAEAGPISKTYQILAQVTPLITKYRPLNKVRGFLLSKDSAETVFKMDSYIIHVKHDNTLGWSASAAEKEWPLTGGLIIMVAPGEFYAAGTGVVITIESTIPHTKVGFISVDEGEFNNGKWIAGRRLNGDQDHQGRHVRIPIKEYGIQHVRLYNY